MNEYFVILLFCLVFLFLKIEYESESNKKVEGFIVSQKYYFGDIRNQSEMKMWIQKHLNPNYIFLDFDPLQPMLATVFWVYCRNIFKKNEFSTKVRPFVIEWRKNDDGTIYKVDSVHPYVPYDKLPFIKNQNQLYATLFDVRLKELIRQRNFTELVPASL